MLAAFQFNLAALSWVAVIVGLFLVYNTLATAVIARRGEIGMLRAVGATRQTVVSLFLAEAAVLGAAGCLLGIPLGRALAWGAVHFTSATVTTLYVADAASVPSLSAAQAIGALVIGVPLAVLSALGPAREAGVVTPVDAIRSAARDSTPARWWIHLTAALACFVAAFLASRQPPLAGVPAFGLAAAVLVVVGVSLLIPAVLASLATVAVRAAPAMGLAMRLATANLAAAVRRLSVSVAALTISLAMLVAIAIMIGSFRETVIYWVGQTLQADLFVATGRRASLDAQPTISEALERTIRHDADVAEVAPFTALTLPYEGRLILLGAAEFRGLESRNAVVFAEPAGSHSVLGIAAANDEVVVSESFSRRFQAPVGANVRLSTPVGARSFRVAGVYFDYSTDRGVVLMDAQTFARAFGAQRPTSLSIYLRPGSNADAVRARLLDTLGPSHHAFIHTNASLRAEVLRIFDATFAITYALEAIAILVALLGVVGAMLTLVIERRDELTTLRFVGADRGQLRRMVMIESGLLGLVGEALGLATGLALSLILIYVVNVQSFGWTIQFHVPVGFLLQAGVVVLIVTTLAGAYPATVAARRGARAHE